MKVRSVSAASAIAAAQRDGMTGNISSLLLREILPSQGADDHQSALELKAEDRALGALHYSDQQFPRF